MSLASTLIKATARALAKMACSNTSEEQSVALLCTRHGQARGAVKRHTASQSDRGNYLTDIVIIELMPETIGCLDKGIVVARMH